MIKILTAALFFCATFVSTAQSQEADSRARLHYSESELSAIKKDPVQLEQVNYLFSSSYELVPSDSANAAPLDPLSINIMQYDFHRYADSRRVIFLTRQHDKIILHSRKEVDAKLEEIKKKTN